MKECLELKDVCLIFLLRYCFILNSIQAFKAMFMARTSQFIHKSGKGQISVFSQPNLDVLRL